MTNRARTDSSNVVCYIKTKGKEPTPLYGCGKAWSNLERLYEMSEVSEKHICRKWLRNECFFSNSECRFKHRLPKRRNLKPKVKKTMEISTMIAKTTRGSVVSAQTSWAMRAKKDTVVKADTVTTTQSGGTCSTGLHDKPVTKTHSDDTTDSIELPAADISDMSVDVSAESGAGSELQTRTWDDDTVAEPDEATAGLEPVVVVSTRTAPMLAETPPASPAPSAPKLFESERVNSFQATPTDAPMKFEPVESCAHSDSSHLASLSEENLRTLNTSCAAHRSYGHSMIYQPTPYSTMAQQVASTYVPIGVPAGFVHPSTLSAVQRKNAELTTQNTALTARLDKMKAQHVEASYAYQTELKHVRRELELSTKREFEAKHATQSAVFEKMRLQAYYNTHIAELGKQVTNLRAETVVYAREIERLKLALQQVQKEPELTANLVVHDIVRPTKHASAAACEVTTANVATVDDSEGCAVEAAAPVAVEEPVRQRRKRSRRTTRSIIKEQVKAPAEEVVAPEVAPEVVAPEESVNPKVEPVPQDEQEQPVSSKTAASTLDLKPTTKPEDFPVLESKTTEVQVTPQKSCCLFKAYDMVEARRELICEDWLCGLCTCKDCAEFQGCEECNCYYNHRMPTALAKAHPRPVPVKAGQVASKTVVKSTRKAVHRSKVQKKLSKFAARQRNRSVRSSRVMKVCGTGIAHRLHES